MQRCINKDRQQDHANRKIRAPQQTLRLKQGIPWLVLAREEDKVPRQRVLRCVGFTPSSTYGLLLVSVGSQTNPCGQHDHQTKVLGFNHASGFRAVSVAHGEHTRKTGLYYFRGLSGVLPGGVVVVVALLGGPHPKMKQS